MILLSSNGKKEGIRNLKLRLWKQVSNMSLDTQLEGQGANSHLGKNLKPQI